MMLIDGEIIMNNCWIASGTGGSVEMCCFSERIVT